ncbi:MAG: protein kinase, partial [Planctomycetes bacterium]|nr:protein kinase [Planctomycetota bacterium]
MPETERCPQCGAPIASDSPEGLCPKCLMGLGLSSPHEAAETTPPTPPGEPSLSPSPAELAPHFPQLEILELIGRGGMGAVYKARQTELDRVVALKILPPTAAADPSFAERFSREAKTLARMNHPHIVAIHDVGRGGGYFYFLMEFVDGVNLRQAIQAKSLSPQDALAVVRQICDALEYAHALGIVHRDIKPDNVLIDKQGRVKIADFGLAKLLAKTPADITLTEAHQAMGTPHYMAPEQLHRPLEVDHRADIYSLGVVFYELLTGELPLGRFSPPSAKVQMDVRLDEIVLRTLEREPDRRYQAASEVKTDVEMLALQPQQRALAAGAEAARKGLARDPWASAPSPGDADRAFARQLFWGLVCLLIALNLGALALALSIEPPKSLSYSFSYSNEVE